MKNLFTFKKRSVAIALAVTLVASLSPLAPTNAAAKKSGGELTVGVFNSLLSSCYSPNASNSALGIMRSVYEGLFEQRRDGTLSPNLAESVTPSSDYKTWTVKLRSGIKFHDGTPLDVTALITNIEASRGTYFASVAAKAGLAGALGAAGHTLSSGIPFVANIKAVTATGSLSAAISLWNGQKDFDETLFASGRQFVRAISDIQNPTQCATAGKGTGPFMFQKLTPTQVVLVRNPNYWRKDADGVQLPYLDKITFNYVNNASQRVKGLKSGTLDAAGFGGGEAKQVFAAKSVKGATLVLSPADYYGWSMFNHAIEPFNNVNARKAVAYAYDANRLFEQFNCYKGTCLGEAPTSIVGKNNIMYNKKSFITYDLAKAKAAAAAYKKDTGKALTFSFPADASADSQASAKVFKQMMKAAGITANISTEDTATITDRAFPSPTSGKVNPYQLYPTTLAEGTGTSFTLPFLQSNSYAAPGNQFLGAMGALAPLFGGFGRVINPARFSDKTQDALVWAAQYDTTATRKANLMKLTEYLQSNASVLAGSATQIGWAFNANVKGYEKFQLAAGGSPKPVSNAGTQWVGVYIEK